MYTIEDGVFQAGYCNFLNANLHRYMLYKLIYEQYLTGKPHIYREQIFECGKKLGLSRNFVSDEIIGCLYAPFLTEKSYDSQMLSYTYNFEIRFKEFFDKPRFETEIPVAIHFTDKAVVLRRYLTSNISSERQDNLLATKWTRNKARFRFQKKIRSLDDFSQTISQTLGEASQLTADVQSSDYIYLIKKYGSYYKNSSNITCNLHSHFCIISRMLPLFPLVYPKLLLTYKKPTDWGGVPIPVCDIVDIVKSIHKDIDPTEFIADSISDGLFRFLSDELLTFTSTGYMAITAYIAEQRSLQCFVRSVTDNNTFSIQIGVNTKTFSELTERFPDFKKANNLGNGFIELVCDRETVQVMFESFYNYHA